MNFILQNIRLLLLIFISCIASTLTGQQISTNVSNEIEFSPASTVYKYGNHYISMNISDPPLHTAFKFKLSKHKFKDNLFFQDHTLKLVKELEVSKGERVFGPFFSSLHRINNRVYFLYFNMAGNEDDGPVQMMAAEIDTVAYDLKPAKEVMAFDFKDLNSRFTFGNINLYEKLEVVPSPNSSVTLIAFSSGSNNRYYYSVVDSSFNVLWTKAGQIESAETVLLQSAAIDNNETVFLGITGKQNNDLENGHVVIGKRKGTDKDVTIDIPEGKAYDVSLIASAKENAIKAVGTYKAGGPNLYGTYSSMIKTGQTRLGPVQLTPFTKELLTELEHDDWGSLKQKYLGICACIEMNALEHENGDIDMTGMFRRRVNSEKNSYSQTGDILVVHVSKGNASFARVPKYRVSAGSTIGNSFAFLEYNNKTFIFYNDNEKNLDKALEKDAANSNVYSNVSLIAATISNGQVVKREKVIDLKNENAMAVPNRMDVAGPGTFIVPVLKIKGLGGIGKTSRLAKIFIK